MHSDETPWEPTAENILDTADHAMHSVLRSPFSLEDRQDAVQAAAVEICYALQRHGNKGRGYSFRVGYFAVCDWLRERCKMMQECDLEPLEWRLSSDEPEDAPELDVERLRAFGTFSDREIGYIRCRIRGYSTREMTQALGVGETAIYRCRKRLLPRLAQLAAQFAD